MGRLTRRMLPALVVMGLVTSSCSFQELLEYTSASGQNTDLTAAEDPDKQAAGHSAEAADKERAAGELLDEGLETKDIAKVEEAAELRPSDPRYPAHMVALKIARGDPPTEDLVATWEPEVRETMRRVHGAHPEASLDEVRRRGTEVMLDALHDTLLILDDPSPERDRLNSSYCASLRSYVGHYEGQFEGELYLATSADWDLC